jgi:menaquinone-9 beta-reductase
VRKRGRHYREGVRLAFRQAQALADALQCGNLAKYERAHRHLTHRPMWMGKLMLQLGRHSDLPERAMLAMKRRPELFARLLSIHVGDANPRDVMTVGAQFGWEFLAA